MEEKIIDIKNLTKIYKNKDLISKNKLHVGIKDITFSVEKGSIFSIIGLNGSGKTTLMKIILDLIRPTSGTCEIFGKKKLRRKDFFDIGYLPESSYFPKSVTLKFLIEYYADLYEIKNKQNRILEVLEVFKINDWYSEKLKNFSKGMLQRVGIAQAILNEPKILFLDEPLSGLDPIGRKIVLDLIIDLNKEEKTTIILNTHILNDLEKIGGQVAFMHNAKILDIIKLDQDILKKGYMIFCEKPLENGYKNGNLYCLNVKRTELDATLKKIIKTNNKLKRIEEEKIDLEKIFLFQINKRR